jgi:hypothetical protein
MIYNPIVPTVAYKCSHTRDEQLIMYLTGI